MNSVYKWTREGFEPTTAETDTGLWGERLVSTAAEYRWKYCVEIRLVLNDIRINKSKWCRFKMLWYSAIHLMDHRIMVQFDYWFKFRLVPNGMNNLVCKNIRVKVQIIRIIVHIFGPIGRLQWHPQGQGKSVTLTQCDSNRVCLLRTLHTEMD